MQDPTNLVAAIMETFDKSAIELFRAWLAERPTTTKWFIGGDFALRDRSRPNDCFAFSIIGYDQTFEDFRADSLVALPRDLKESRELTAEGIAWLRDHRCFHIAFPINADRQFFFEEGKTAVQVARESLAATARHFIEHERGDEVVRRVKQAVQKSKANGFPLGLFTDLTILALLLPAVTLLLARERRPDVVGWFCDRDSMTSWSDALIWNIAIENVLGLAERFNIDLGAEKPVIGVPDRSGVEERMWFDHFIRPADWLAGALAAWEREGNDLPGEHSKYRQMVEQVCADCTNAVFLPVQMDRAGIQVSRLLLSRQPIAE